MVCEYNRLLPLPAVLGVTRKAKTSMSLYFSYCIQGVSGNKWTFISREQGISLLSRDEKFRERWNLLQIGNKGEKVKFSRDQGNMLPPSPTWEALKQNFPQSITSRILKGPTGKFNLRYFLCDMVEIKNIWGKCKELFGAIRIISSIVMKTKTSVTKFRI